MARPVREINAGSMADIAFLLLIFFLVTTTMDVDTGITRKLPPPLDPNAEPPKVKERNILKVLVNKNDRLMVDGKPATLSNLAERTKTFLTNPQNKENMPEMRVEEIDYLGRVKISKGIISLKNDRGTSYDMYIQVQNELTKAVNEMRNDLAQRKFGIKYDKLKNEEYRKAIQEAVPVPISEAEPEDVGE
ncbi:MAG: biopolymer transporter ExbD [Bacteroidales bacterium]|nr:biopolymer transporter ExbD [Bacteroidales bacterium]